MIGRLGDSVELAAHVALAALIFSLILSLYRLLRGPSTADRVVALDLIALIAVAFMAVETVLTGEALLLRPASVLALISFLGTVAIARFLEVRRL